MILADNSQSLLIQDDNATGTRGEWLRKRAPAGSAVEDTARARF